MINQDNQKKIEKNQNNSIEEIKNITKEEKLLENNKEKNIERNISYEKKEEKIIELNLEQPKKHEKNNISLVLILQGILIIVLSILIVKTKMKKIELK